MAKEILGIRHILGLKVKDLRLSKGLSYQDLSTKTGLSISYLSEIEKGKKYPKGDKILSLATALDVEYDYLVSLKVSKRMEPLVNMINSEFLKEFPLEMYGLDVQKVLQVLSDAPEKLNAFVNSITQIARNYEMTKEHFYHASLRSYQELNDNYFQDLESATRQFREEFSLASENIKQEELVEILKEYFDILVDFEKLSNQDVLKNVRSYLHPDKQVLHINKGLKDSQINFLLGRELAYAYLELTQRPLETPPQNNYTFEVLLNNYKASYFSAALLIDQDSLVSDLKSLGTLEHWNNRFLIELLQKYNATPEMLMQRLTNLLPKFFNIKNLFFLRFVGNPSEDEYQLTKELHLHKMHTPHSNELNEHYCRRWLALKIMGGNREQNSSSSDVIADAQISHYWQTKDEYLIISLAFPNASNASEMISISIGFFIDKQLAKTLPFLGEERLPKVTVHTTCERCSLPDCNERKSPSIILSKLDRQAQINQALESIAD